MQIQGTHQVHGAHALQGPHSTRAAGRAEGPSAQQPADQVDISPAAQAASEAKEVDGVRTDLVARLRSEIASGTYETADKVEGAVDRLLNAIG